MKHFTIDAENNITVHASKKAARETGEGVFSSEVELADLIGPDNKRLVEIWKSIPGVTPVTKFANRKVGTERIWKAIQSLGDTPAAPPAAEPQDTAIDPATPFDEGHEADIKRKRLEAAQVAHRFYKDGSWVVASLQRATSGSRANPLRESGLTRANETLGQIVPNSSLAPGRRDSVTGQPLRG